MSEGILSVKQEREDTPHKRSDRGKLRQKQRLELFEQQKTAKKLIIEESYNDSLKHEIICRSNPDKVTDFLKQKFEGVLLGAVPQVEPGLILSNDYGHGAFQT